MDLDGIDAAFLYPSMGLFASAVHDPNLSAALCRAYNSWLTDYCKPHPDRLFGIAILPMQSVEHAIQEMKFAQQGTGHARRLLAAQPLQRPADPRSGVRAVLERSRGVGFLDRLP